MNSNHQIFEPLRIKYRQRGSFKGFYNRFGGKSSNDVIVCGRINTDEEKEMLKEAQQYSLNLVDAITFFDPFEGLLNRIIDETKGTSLDRLSFQKIENKLCKIKEAVKKSLQE